MAIRDAKGRIMPSAISASKPVRIRFVKMLRVHGVVSHAAAELGVPITVLYRARAKFADFAAAWDAALGQARGTTVPTVEEWGAQTRQIYLNELSITASPVRAAERVERSVLGALRLRGRSKTFAKSWDAAMARSLQLIEAEVYARVLGGVRAGGKPGSKANPDGAKSTAYSDRLTMFLLKAAMPERYDRPRGSVDAKHLGPKLSRAEMVARLKQLAERFATGETISAKPPAANTPGYSDLTPGDAGINELAQGPENVGANLGANLSSRYEQP